MSRRIALAVSLALTTVVVFGIVALGGQAGLFLGGGGESEAAALQEDTVSDGAVVQDVEPIPVVAPEVPSTEPRIITEYVYIDEPAPAIQQVASAPAPAFVAAPETPGTGTPVVIAEPPSGNSSGWYDDDDEYEEEEDDKDKDKDDDDDEDDEDD